MTNNSALDEHIKEKFGNYSPDVPSYVWENIIAEKEKRRPAGLWVNFFNKNLALLLFGIAIAGSGIIIYKNVYSPAGIKTNATNEPVKTINKTGNNIIAKNDNEHTNGTNNVTTGKPLTSGTNNIISSENNSTATRVNQSSGNITINNTNNFQTSAISTDQNNLKSPFADNNSANRSKNKKTKYLKGSAVISYKNPEAVTDDITGTYTNDILLNRFLLNLDIIRSERTFIPSVKKINNLHLDIPCPEAEKNAAGNKRYFEIYGGADYAFRSITDTGKSAYLQKRKESTSFSSAFSVGLRYTKVFSNGMSFRTGINYSQINEKFKFAQGNIIQVIYIINNNGDTTGSYTTTGTRYKTTYNKFRTVDIPLLVGYELGNGRIHANFNAGVIINAYSWQKGDVLDTAYQPVNITTGKTSSPYQFKTNVGIGFMGAVSVYYKLTDKWHIFTEPYFRYNLSPASKAELTLKQKYNTAGLRLGVRFDF